MKKKRLSVLELIIRELWEIRNPHQKDNEGAFQVFKEKMLDLFKYERTGNKLWTKPLLKKASFELSTARNRNLISIDEQNELRQTVVAFFGLSVGSHAALTWMMESRADIIKIIDPDIIAPTNLNRIRTGWQNIGRPKVDVIAEELYKINPYVKIDSFHSGSMNVAQKIFNSGVDIIVDEIDDIEMKIFLRKQARDKGIALISAADVGENIVLDIERYDKEPQPELFLGRVKDIEGINFSTLPMKEKRKLIIDLVGFEENAERMLDSLFAIGGSIVTWPQLGATATISGGVITTVIKKLIIGEDVRSGRYFISLDRLLVSDFNTRKRVLQRNSRIREIKEVLEK